MTLRPSLQPAQWGNREVFLFYLIVSVIWSWPLALSPAASTVSLHFDQFPAAWLVHAAPDYWDGVYEGSAWPDGEPLARLDSFLFLGLAFLLHGLVPGLLLTNLLVLLGPPLSALAAERFARVAFDIKPPASLIAGLAFGFAPLATVGLLEGHVYYLLNPWLPACATALVQRRDGAALLHWTLCLLTTAYMGINASLLIVAVLLYQRRFAPRLLVGMAVVGGAYAAFFLSSAVHSQTGADAAVRLGNASLTTLIAWTPWLDLNRHSLGPAFGPGVLALALLAPWAGVPHARFWLGLGLLTLLLTLGPVLELGVARLEGWPTLLYPLLKTGIFDTFRFPIRFAWVGALVLGGLAAALSARARWVGVLLGLVLLDVLVFSGAYLRLRAHPAPVPSIYRALPEGPVLDLYPDVGGIQEDIGFYFQNLSCYYQMEHQRPILDRCLNTDLDRNPRRAFSATLHAQLLEGADVASTLKTSGIASVVVHANLYQPHERSAVINGLTQALGPPPLQSTDGGEWLLGWRVAQ